MIFRNTTDIPDRLIAIAVAHSLPEGVVIDEIVIKNKMENHVTGQWGWYYPNARKIVLIVPRSLDGYIGKLKYTRLPISFNSRVEFVIAVMAHEIRHAWQYQKSIGREMTIREKEVDAERYERAKLYEWRAKLDQMEKAASSSK